MSSAYRRPPAASRKVAAGLADRSLRRLKTTRLDIRPMYYWTGRRITAHVKLCVLALMIRRVAEDPEKARNITTEADSGRVSA